MRFGSQLGTLLAASIALAPAAFAQQAPVLLSDFNSSDGVDEGIPQGFGSVLNRNDDGSTVAINVLEAFPEGVCFYGQEYDELFVNNNGNIINTKKTMTQTIQQTT